MAEHTDIQWADSTLNLQMGCDGCELWNPKAGVRRCYAGILVQRYGAHSKGYPKSFDKPVIFAERMKQAERWKDLTGTKRPDKPALSGLPRIVFLDDMGDTFTESLPLDWLAPFLPRMAVTPHIYMLLTKRGRRMREFSERHPLPENVWPGVSLTTQQTTVRITELLQVKGGGVKWVSAEPLWGPIDLREVPGPGLNGHPLERTHPYTQFLGMQIGLVIVGGESGADAKPFDLAWARSLRDQCKAAKAAFFFKQAGSKPVGYWLDPTGRGDGICYSQTGECWHLKDSKGGDLAELPHDVRVRQFPTVPVAQKSTAAFASG